MKEDKWDNIIKPKRSLLEFDFKSLWQYRDLLRMLVYRDFVTYYEQTILISGYKFLNERGYFN